MTTQSGFGFAVALLALTLVAAAQGPPHVILHPDSVIWGPASPKLPPGAQFASVLGDPSRPGEPYVFRAKLPDGYSVPPHWHPMDEHVTVIQGVFRLGFGTKFDSSALRDLPAGSFAMLPKDAPHYNIVRGETILQFHGIGPYDITYVHGAANQNGKRVERIDTAFCTKAFVHNHAVKLDLATCVRPNGHPCEHADLRPINWPICPVIARTVATVSSLSEIIDVATGGRVNTVPLNGRLTDNAAPDIVDASPSGTRLFVALGGPVRLSGDPHNAIGSTPGWATST